MQLNLDDGTEFSLFEQGSDTADKGLLIIHDWWGVLDYNHAWAKVFADLGYRAAVIDLYDGENPTDPKLAGEKMRSIDQNVAGQKLDKALQQLQTHPRKMGVLGWSFGGVQAMQATFARPDLVQATAFCYCRAFTEPQQLNKLQGPVLSVYSETERTWPEKQEKFEAAMDRCGKRYTAVSYAADHGFVNPDSPRFDADAAKATQKVVVDFFQRCLG